jgi:hypothetical protein
MNYEILFHYLGVGYVEINIFNIFLLKWFLGYLQNAIVASKFGLDGVKIWDKRLVSNINFGGNHNIC